MPKGKHIVKLPGPTNISSDHWQFKAQWSQEENKVHLHRDFAASFDQPVCSGDLRKAAAKALRAILDSFRTQISLADD